MNDPQSIKEILIYQLEGLFPNGRLRTEQIQRFVNNLDNLIDVKIQSYITPTANPIPMHGKMCHRCGKNVGSIYVLSDDQLTCHSCLRGGDTIKSQIVGESDVL